MTRWWDKYSMIPFQDLGRDETGCDCYGLVRLIYEREVGVELPALCFYENTKQREVLGDAISEQPALLGFEPVSKDAVEPFDVLVISHAGWACHLGIVINDRLCIHTEAKKGVVVEEFRRPHLWPRVKEAYRCQNKRK